MGSPLLNYTFLPFRGGGPGQRPGECERRIAGRDACPTQKGRHPPQRGVSALPLPGAPLYFFAHIAPTRTAGRCDKNLSCFSSSRASYPSPRRCGRAHSFRRSSSPHRNRFAGLRRGPHLRPQIRPLSRPCPGIYQNPMRQTRVLVGSRRNHREVG